MTERLRWSRSGTADRSAKGRIIDLSPRTAKLLGFINAGVARVEVTPITVPQPNGSIKSVVALSEPDKTDAQRGAW